MKEEMEMEMEIVNHKHEGLLNSQSPTTYNHLSFIWVRDEYIGNNHYMDNNERFANLWIESEELLTGSNCKKSRCNSYI